MIGGQKSRDHNLVAIHKVKLRVLEDRDWEMRGFVLINPTAVLWCIGHNLEPRGSQK